MSKGKRSRLWGADRWPLTTNPRTRNRAMAGDGRPRYDPVPDSGPTGVFGMLLCPRVSTKMTSLFGDWPWLMSDNGSEIATQPEGVPLTVRPDCVMVTVPKYRAGARSLRVQMPMSGSAQRAGVGRWQMAASVDRIVAKLGNLRARKGQALDQVAADLVALQIATREGKATRRDVLRWTRTAAVGLAGGVVATGLVHYDAEAACPGSYCVRLGAAYCKTYSSPCPPTQCKHTGYIQYVYRRYKIVGGVCTNTVCAVDRVETFYSPGDCPVGTCASFCYPG